jgi:uracil-DNA glycosylase
MPTWTDVLKEEKESEYFQKAYSHSQHERNSGKNIYPDASNVFQAFVLTPFDDVRVVILGQDPYHGAGQAMGLSFSVPEAVKIPPSLRNIYQELHTDLGLALPTHGNLTHWATQGVLLLNSVLSVEGGMPGSHAGLGWEQFTDAVIRILSERRERLVFILWGNYAKQKAALIDTTKHTIITSPHPSPFSAYSGFFGSRPFSQTNAALERYGYTPIDWSLPDRGTNQKIIVD